MTMADVTNPVNTGDTQPIEPVSTGRNEASHKYVKRSLSISADLLAAAQAEYGPKRFSSNIERLIKEDLSVTKRQREQALSRDEAKAAWKKDPKRISTYVSGRPA